MRVKIMTFRYSASLGGFDDTPLTEFLRERELIAFREHFFHVGGIPHLTCILHLQDPLLPEDAVRAALDHSRASQRGNAKNTMAGSSPRGGERPRAAAPGPCEGLSESERILFHQVREWRADRARREGVPPYVILTNKQLVTILRRRPDSLTALSLVEGVGPGKLKRYGAAILEQIHGKQVLDQGSPGETPLESTAPARETDGAGVSPAQEAPIAGSGAGAQGELPS